MSEILARKITDVSTQRVVKSNEGLRDPIIIILTLFVDPVYR